MKTKTALLTSLIFAIILIIYSFVHGAYDHEVKQDYSHSMESARSLGKTIKEPDLKPYAISTRFAGVGIGILSLILLAASIITFRKFKMNKGLYIAHVLYLAFIGISLLFCFALLTSTGAVSFDETYVLWVILGMVSIVLSLVSLKKLPTIMATA